MMSIKMIASDIDGTLLQNGATEISPLLFEQVRALKARGIAFCAASGRQHGSLRKLFAPVADDIWYICENGGICFAPGGGIAGKTPVKREVALALSHQILDIPHFEVLISGAETSYLIPKHQDYLDHIRYFVGNHVTIIPSPEAIEEDILKVSAYCPDGALQYQDEWRRRWGSEVQIALGGSLWLDCGVASKREGILTVCKAAGIDPGDVMAFGDNHNDLPMLGAVGHPYLMEGAPAELGSLPYPKTKRPEAVIARLLEEI